MSGGRRVRWIGLIVGLWALCGVLAPASASDAFSENTNLIALTRVNSLADTDAQINEWLNEIRGAAVDLHPVRALAARVLHNRTLEGLERDPWMESLFFSMGEDGEGWVIAVPVLGRKAYMTALLAQGHFREESESDGIVLMRETIGQQHQFLSITFLPNGISLISSSEAALRHARLLYAQAGRQGLLTGRGESVVLRLHLRRYLHNIDSELRVALEDAREDIVRDLISVTASEDVPLNIFLGRVFHSGVSLLQECLFLDLSLKFSGDEILAKGAIALKNRGTIDYALTSMEDREGGWLAEKMPEGVISVREARIWPELVSEVAAGSGAGMLAAFSGRFGETAQGEAALLLDALQDVDLQGMATGILPASVTGSGPAQVTYLQIGNLEAFDTFSEDLTERLGGGALSEALSEKGIKVEIEQRSVVIPGGDAVRVSVFVRSQNLPLPGVVNSLRTMWVTRVGSLVVILSPAVHPGAEQVEEMEPAMLSVLSDIRRTLEGGGGAPALWRTSLREETGPRVFWMTAFDPLALVVAAVKSAAVWPMPEERRLRSGQAVPWEEYVRSFAPYLQSSPPVTLALNSHVDAMQFRLRIPVASLTHLARALLDLPPASSGQ